MIVIPTLLAQAGQYASHKTDYGLILIQWFLPLFPIAFCVLLAVCIWRAARYFGSAGQEQKLLRIEMGKLAEEVHLLRKDMNGDKKQATSIES
jgi:hypothetical protein